MGLGSRISTSVNRVQGSPPKKGIVSARTKDINTKFIILSQEIILLICERVMVIHIYMFHVPENL